MNLYDEYKNPVGLKEVCEWFIETYPEDIFLTEPWCIVQIRNNCDSILKEIGGKNSINSKKVKS